MKKLFVISMMLIGAVTAGAKGKSDWKGRVIDQKGEPVEYANVVVLSKADSSVVCGTVTAEDGSFNVVTSETDGIMMVAMIGYQTIYMVPVDGAVITLLEDVNMLEGAVVTAIMPKTKLTGEISNGEVYNQPISPKQLCVMLCTQELKSAILIHNGIIVMFF